MYNRLMGDHVTYVGSGFTHTEGKTCILCLGEKFYSSLDGQTKEARAISVIAAILEPWRNPVLAGVEVEDSEVVEIWK